MTWALTVEGRPPSTKFTTADIEWWREQFHRRALELPAVDAVELEFIPILAGTRDDPFVIYDTLARIAAGAILAGIDQAPCPDDGLFDRERILGWTHRPASIGTGHHGMTVIVRPLPEQPARIRHLLVPISDTALNMLVARIGRVDYQALGQELGAIIDKALA